MMRKLIVFVMLLSGCTKEPPPTPERVRPVRVIEVTSSGGDRVRRLSGTSQAGQSSVLSFKVSGTVQKIAVKVGDRVDKGQLIAELDSADYQLQVQEARAALAQVRAQSKNAKATYDRVRALWENKNAAKTDLDAARAGYETTSAQVASVLKRLELARRQLDYCVLKSPGAGAVATVRTEVGENVSPGQPVAMVTSGGKPEVAVEVPETLIARISEGSKVVVSFDALPDKTYDAVVSEVGVAPQTGATTFPVIAKLTSESSDVRPGLAAEVRFEFESTGPKDRHLVPPFAVQSDASGPFVFVALRDSGTVRRKSVEVGELTTEGLEVLTGLSDGDLLVTAGVTKLREGQKVRIPGAKAQEE